jgi:hypothetical protein
MNTQIRNRIKRVVGLFALLSFLLITLSNFQGMVLCFENDGRVTLESAIGGICSDSFESAQQVQQVAASKTPTWQGLNCKRCFDLPISMESADHQNPEMKVFQGPVQMPLIAEAPPIPVGYLATVTENLLPQPPPLRPAIHRFLNTVVLLI